MGTANLIYGIAVGMAICTTIIYWHHTLEMNELKEAQFDDMKQGLMTKKDFKKMIWREDMKRSKLRGDKNEEEKQGQNGGILTMEEVLARKEAVRNQGEKLQQSLEKLDQLEKKLQGHKEKQQTEMIQQVQPPIEKVEKTDADSIEEEGSEETADTGSQEENLDEDEQKEVAQFHNKNVIDKNADAINGYPLGKLGKSECPAGIDVSYWSQLSQSDLTYRSPFGKLGPELKFVTFEPDHGGWNNIRMAMETVMVFAHATGRILVMPPDQPLYLLNKDNDHKAHGFADFFQLQDIHESGAMEIIEMENFLKDYGKKGLLPKPFESDVQNIYQTSGRQALWDYLRDIGEKPKWDPFKVGCVIPDSTDSIDSPIDPSVAHVKDFLGDREAVYYYKELREATVVHFPSNHKLGYRYLTHFYTFIYFVDDWMDRFYKRFIRDAMHYREDIYCAASCVVRQLWEETGGSYSSFHIRRGDFQYKVVKLPAEDLYENSKDQLNDGEYIYIATDERNKAFFDPFRSRYKIRFLDDYMDSCDLHSINKNYYGMIDQIISSYGRIFFGTWFSTFTGYITRMRGYLGFENRSNWYFHKPKKEAFQHHDKEWWPDTPFYKREWPVAWTDIDEAK
mmetsp:Transcript_11694/g.15268  ORF Transcript_11694/g.15268 Transcript_11694/m.15268 type:complete len:621 (-) Transcript_11694:154-2016(-)|eukprot:CAMPEP_0117757882 /NCGR_PEP_ID=MMETSP0947-20121206/15019_1 /TAXON_ID=44440 /ORGANISM="Chattonella subsalsa, Strain CCMP2191" /LENGTH=620 /DNA_ID=CAMNT_0005577907 /DNA_START=57 /DNA_END=1919 /DNA_ORIENTATION=+